MPFFFVTRVGAVIAAADVDPIDEAPQINAQPPAVAQPVRDVSDTADDTQREALSDENADQALFGLLWPLNEVVKLDPPVDRAQFRKQRNRLKELGYRFDPMTQD